MADTLKTICTSKDQMVIADLLRISSFIFLLIYQLGMPIIMTYTIFYLVDLNTSFVMKLSDKPKHKFFEGYLTPSSNSFGHSWGCTILTHIHECTKGVLVSTLPYHVCICYTHYNSQLCTCIKDIYIIYLIYICMVVSICQVLMVSVVCFFNTLEANFFKKVNQKKQLQSGFNLLRGFI